MEDPADIYDEITGIAKSKEEGTSDGAKKGWLTRKRGGKAPDEDDWNKPVEYDDYDDLNKDQMDTEMNRYFDDFDYDTIKSQFNSDKSMASPEIDGDRMKLGSKSNIMSDQLAGQNGEIKDQAMSDYFEGGKGDQIIKDKLGPEYSLQVEGDDVYIVKDDSVNEPESSEPEETGPQIKYAQLDDYGMGLEEGKDYEITEFGSISYIGGFQGMLDRNGYDQVDDDDIRSLIDYEYGNGETDVSPDDFDDNPEQAIYDYLQEKQNDNTYNYSSAIEKDLNYGFFEVGDRTYMSFKEHQGGDVRGNYSDSVLYDITDFDNGATGDPKMDISALIDPRIYAQVEHNGEQHDVTFDGGMNGAEWNDGKPEGVDDYWDYTDAFNKFKNKPQETPSDDEPSGDEPSSVGGIDDEGDSWSDNDIESDVKDELKELTGDDDLEIEDVYESDAGGSSYGKTLSLTNGQEWQVYDSYDDAVDAVKERVKNELDSGEFGGWSAGFNESFAEGYLTFDDDMSRQYADEFAESYRDSIEGDSYYESEAMDAISDDPERYGLTQEDVDEESDAFNEQVQLLVPDLVEVAVDNYRDDIFEQLKDDAKGYIEDNFGSEEFERMVQEGQFTLDTDSMVEDAIANDGLGTYISGYDSNYEETKSGKILARHN